MEIRLKSLRGRATFRAAKLICFSSVCTCVHVALCLCALLLKDSSFRLFQVRDTSGDSPRVYDLLSTVSFCKILRNAESRPLDSDSAPSLFAVCFNVRIDSAAHCIDLWESSLSASTRTSLFRIWCANRV